MKKIALTLLLALVASTSAMAQAYNDTLPHDATPHHDDSLNASPSAYQVHPLRLVARAYGDSIVLRWAIDNAGAWLAANRYGYNIYRSSNNPDEADDPSNFFLDTLRLGDSLFVDTIRLRRLNPHPLRPLTLDQFMQRFPSTNLYAGAAAQALYGTLTYDVNRDPVSQPNDFIGLAYHQYQEQTQRQLLALLAAESDPQVASALALRFVDRDVKPGILYEYTVECLVPPELADVQGTSILVPCKPYLRADDEKIPALTITQLDPRRVALRWNRNRLSGYFVERSASGRPWQRLNTNAPIWPLNPDEGTRAVYGDSIAEWMKTQIVFIDSLSLDSSYSYRVSGFDPFGDRADWRLSDPFRLLDLLPPPSPIVDPVVTEDNRRCLLSWQPGPDASQNDLLGYYVAFSATSGGPWKTVSPLIDPKGRYWIDSIADLHGRGFYRVFAIDTAGNVSYSTAVLNHIEDVYPPAAPQGLHGAVDDSVGYVYLSWQPNTDIDLLAYKVYYANERDHAFIERSKGYIDDTLFLDSINVSTLTSEVFYYVIAVDRNHNYSAPSDTLRLRLPDHLAPGPCLLDNLQQDADSVVIHWLPSVSSDVERYCIYRRLRTANQWNLLKMVSPDSVANVIRLVDRPERNVVPYAYAVEAIDSARNSSGYAGQAVAFFPPSRLLDATLQVKAKAKKGEGITLTWDIDYKGRKDYYGIVYRSSDGGATFTDVASFSRGTESWCDLQVEEGRGYQYYIQLRLLDGTATTPASNTASATAK